MHTFKTFLLNEIKDSKRNRAEVITAYGLTDHAPEHVAQERAKDIIDNFTKVEPLIDLSYDYFQVPNGKKYNPKDIFSWARVSADQGHDKLEALQNLEAMIANLKRSKEKKTQAKLSEKDYDVLHDSKIATLYRPKSEAASCKLGASTKWCTSATGGTNQFDSYTAQGIVLFYAIEKATQAKYAVAMYPDGQTMQVFDAEDNRIEWHEWEDIAAQLGIPTDIAFYAKHGPQPIDILKKRVNEARSLMSGQTKRDPYEPQANWELLGDVLKSVETIFKGKDPEQLAALEKYRRDKGMPDEVFLMDVSEAASLEYFLDREYNPVGSHNWSNAQFQEEIVRHINRLATITKQVNGEDWQQEDVEDMDDLTNKVAGPTDGDERRNVFHQMRVYISRHMKDKWPEIEKALINLWVTNHEATEIKVQGGYSELTDHPFDSTHEWLGVVMDYKNGEWPELEETLHKRIKTVLHKDALNDNLINGLVSMGLSYNRIANNKRGRDVIDHRAYVPESKEHLKRYADGEWDMDGPPLTQRAEMERRWKKSNSGGMDELIDKL
ncbi:hypothetical protein CL634_02670 [bacterium]|nr:hypothetical protein [bacterium]